MNLVVLKGNLTKDIELKYTPNGTAIGKSSIAITDGFGDNQKTFFFDLTFWGKTAEMVNQYFNKGSQILINGRLAQDTWTAQDGTSRSKVHVIVERVEFCGKKNKGDVGSTNTTSTTSPAQTNQVDSQVPAVDIDEEEVPF